MHETLLMNHLHEPTCVTNHNKSADPDCGSLSRHNPAISLGRKPVHEAMLKYCINIIS
jgi:hypothetical protein